MTGDSHRQSSEEETILNIVLLHPEIPHNTGAIGRLCVGLGARLHLIKPLGFNLTDAAVKRAGLDYWHHLDVSTHTSWNDFMKTESPARLMFASTRGTKDLFECSFSKGDYIVFGSETSGLPDEFYTEYSESLFQIPMPGAHARSINLANSAGIVMYEAYRQIRAYQPQQTPYLHTSRE